LESIGFQLYLKEIGTSQWQLWNFPMIHRGTIFPYNSSQQATEISENGAVPSFCDLEFLRFPQLFHHLPNDMN